MIANTSEAKSEIRRARPGALRDIQRDWERWNLGERIAIGIVICCSLSLLSIGHWLGAV
jgi:hypothetical protein